MARTPRSRNTGWILGALCGLLWIPHGGAQAQIVREVPELAQVGVVEHREEMLPLDLEFVDDRGETVRLGDYFLADRPVLLTLNYYGCPMLCGLQLNGLVAGLQDLEWTAGQEFEIVTISINPRETFKLAALKKQSYLNEYGRPEAGPGWHFLTGQQPQIDSLATATGFGYQYLESSGEYSHAAVAFVATPEGKLSRYLYGVVYDANTLRYSLVEAGEGRIGTTLDRIILYCFHYDASAGAYTPVVMNIMRAGALLCAFVLAVVLIGFWGRETRRKRMTTVGVEL